MIDNESWKDVTKDACCMVKVKLKVVLAWVHIARYLIQAQLSLYPICMD